MNTRIAILLLALAPGLVRGADGIYEVRFRGCGALTLEGGGEGGKTVFTVGRPSGGPYKGGTQNSVSKYLSYATKVHMIKAKKPLPPSEKVANCMVNIANRADKVSVRPDGTSFTAELKRIEGRDSGFMKVELK